MFKALKSTDHNVNVTIDIDSEKVLKPVVKTAGILAVIGVASHAVNAFIDLKLSK